MSWLRRHGSCIFTGLLISAIVGGIGILFVGKEPGTCHPPVDHQYKYIKTVFQETVTAYMADHNGERPPHESTYNIAINGHEHIQCDVIDICALVSNHEDMLRVVPDGCYGEKGEVDTNFYSGECDNGDFWGEYVWLMDDEGQVYTTWIGELCDENNADGYQGVWIGSYIGYPPSWWSKHWAGTVALIVITVLVFFISLLLCVWYKWRTGKSEDHL